MQPAATPNAHSFGVDSALIARPRRCPGTHPGQRRLSEREAAEYLMLSVCSNGHMGTPLERCTTRRG